MPKASGSISISLIMLSKQKWISMYTGDTLICPNHACVSSKEAIATGCQYLHMAAVAHAKTAAKLILTF